MEVNSLARYATQSIKNKLLKAQGKRKEIEPLLYINCIVVTAMHVLFPHGKWKLIHSSLAWVSYCSLSLLSSRIRGVTTEKLIHGTVPPAPLCFTVFSYSHAYALRCCCQTSIFTVLPIKTSSMRNGGVEKETGIHPVSEQVALNLFGLMAPLGKCQLFAFACFLTRDE